VKSRPFGGGNTYVLLYIIDAEGGKKLQDFLKIYEKFTKTCKNFISARKKADPTRVGQVKEYHLRISQAARPAGWFVMRLFKRHGSGFLFYNYRRQSRPKSYRIFQKIPKKSDFVIVKAKLTRIGHRYFSVGKVLVSSKAVSLGLWSAKFKVFASYQHSVLKGAHFAIYCKIGTRSASTIKSEKRAKMRQEKIFFEILNGIVDTLPGPDIIYI